MCLTAVLVPAALALFVYALVLLVHGLRHRRREKLVFAAGIFAFLLAGSTVLMEFITRPL